MVTTHAVATEAGEQTNLSQREAGRIQPASNFDNFGISHGTPWSTARGRSLHTPPYRNVPFSRGHARVQSSHHFTRNYHSQSRASGQRNVTGSPHTYLRMLQARIGDGEPLVLFLEIGAVASWLGSQVLMSFCNCFASSCTARNRSRQRQGNPQPQIQVPSALLHRSTVQKHGHVLQFSVPL